MLGGPGGGGRENELELLIAGLWFMDKFDIEFPILPIEKEFCAGVLLDQGFDAALAPQFTEPG